MSQQSLFNEGIEEFDLPDSELHYHPQFLPKSTANRLLHDLKEKIEWTQNTIRFYGKQSLVPRLEAWYGDPGKSYAYSGIHMNPKPWTADLLEIKDPIEKQAGVTFNSVLINYYRDGKDRVAWHSDNEKELGEHPVIASLSLGSARKFLLKHNQTKQKIAIILESGSLLLMKGETQEKWIHSLPKTKIIQKSRINLTFRFIHS